MDPHLSRTVVVSTKLDTRLPQFARGHDVELFLRPPGRLLEPGMLGSCPFFTCAPSSALAVQRCVQALSLLSHAGRRALFCGPWAPAGARHAQRLFIASVQAPSFFRLPRSSGALSAPTWALPDTL